MAEILKRYETHIFSAEQVQTVVEGVSERGRQNWEEYIEEASVVRYALVESTTVFIRAWERK